MGGAHASTQEQLKPPCQGNVERGTMRPLASTCRVCDASNTPQYGCCSCGMRIKTGRYGQPTSTGRPAQQLCTAMHAISNPSKRAVYSDSCARQLHPPSSLTHTCAAHRQDCTAGMQITPTAAAGQPSPGGHQQPVRHSRTCQQQPDTSRLNC